MTHAMDGFVHKAFSVAYGTSFDEVSEAYHTIEHPLSLVACSMMKSDDTICCCGVRSASEPYAVAHACTIHTEAT